MSSIPAKHMRVDRYYILRGKQHRANNSYKVKVLSNRLDDGVTIDARYCNGVSISRQVTLNFTMIDRTYDVEIDYEAEVKEDIKQVLG